MSIYPLKLIPRPSERLWGGSKLKTFVPSFGHLQTTEPIGEAWLVYAENEVANGPLQGQTLQAVADSLGQDLLGSKSVSRYGNKVPLLAKFIDARDKLSIQVHPDDVYALNQEAATGHLGKTEAWYILEAEPEAHIIWGFNQALNKDTLKQAVLEGNLEAFLNKVPVKAGDVIYNPAGTVHAIGSGILLFEIQQSSDLTYRLYDYNRRDAAGNLRDLHLDKALDVASLESGEHAKVTPQIDNEQSKQLIQSEHFVMEKLHIDQTLERTTSSLSLELITVISGTIFVNTQSTQLELNKASSAVLPASLHDYTLSGKGELIRCYMP